MTIEVIYMIDDDAKMVIIAKVSHRRDAYRNLDQLDPTEIVDMVQNRLATLRSGLATPPDET